MEKEIERERMRKRETKKERDLCSESESVSGRE